MVNEAKCRVESSPVISVAAPAYNEAETVCEVVRGWQTAVSRLGIRAEFVVCNDGSTDTTLELLQALTGEIPDLHIVDSKENGGYGNAMTKAIAACQGDYVVTIDSDGQFDLADIEHFLPFVEGGRCAAVTGRRVRKQDSVFRYAADRILNLIVRILFGTRLRDTNCALKMVRRDLMQGLDLEAGGYPFPTEVCLRLERLGVDLREAPIRHLERTGGRSKLQVWRTGWRMFWFLVYLRLQFALRRTRTIRDRENNSEDERA